MGQLNIGNAVAVDIDDDLLAHVHAVVVAKLRRNEPVLVEWTTCDGQLRQAWIHPATVVLAGYTTSSAPALDRPWLERLMTAANSVTGISLDVADLHRHSADVVPCVPNANRRTQPEPNAAG